jgi:sugar/nucleoside kinase (ribokinase family)
MARLLAIGHVTWDLLGHREVLGGSVAYAASCAYKLGWQAAILTSAGSDFEPSRHLPGITVYSRPSPCTTRFKNIYDEDGSRRQLLLARAEDIFIDQLSDEWRDPDVLLICPVAGEISGAFARSFTADVVGATGQGWLRGFDSDGYVRRIEFLRSAECLEGVHTLFLSCEDLPDAEARAASFLKHAPIVIVTRGWRGLTLLMRDAVHTMPALPRNEVDPTGAGDVFAAAFLVGYHDTGDPLEAAAFGACAASCVVEGWGLSTIGDRAEVERRMALHKRWIEEGDWEE